ncbi:phage protease [Methylomonas sp. MS20]|uniref:phage protease n=1 Tax=unclassified Methylomonas TaxID=2608980 RepID=UPI0028A51713|nr:phage protease [Methylomonas sp. MV1]MDT4328535.1 phage protease [Methylomonas sp. MV1]
MSKPAVKLAALAFEIAADGSAPTTAHLLPVGPFRATDGRPHDCEAWQLDASIAASVILRLRDRANDTLIDYEHQSLRTEWNGQPVIAAGWFHDMEWRDGKGLYAIGVDWTATAKQRIADKEYRYISAVFLYLASTGEVLDVISVALTNTPAVDGLDDLSEDGMAALTKRFSLPDPDPETTDMATPQEELAALRVTHAQTETTLAALTAERDTLKTQLAALTTERDTAIGELAALNKQVAESAAAAEADKKDALILAALTAGSLTPSMRLWAEKQTLAALTEYLEATGPLPILKRQAGDGHTTATAALTAEQKAIADKMGVTEEEYLAAQKKHAI